MTNPALSRWLLPWLMLLTVCLGALHWAKTAPPANSFLAAESSTAQARNALPLLGNPDFGLKDVSGASVAAKGGIGVLDDAAFAQVPAKSTKAFSPEGQKLYSQMAGKPINTVDDLTQALNDGLIKPNQLPIDYVMIDGQKVIANTRTTTALTNAGIPKSQWLGVNKTGQTAYPGKTFDSLVRDQLNKNYGGSVGNARR